MRQRILVILGTAVVLLALYTFLFRARPSSPAVLSNMTSVAGQLQMSVAAKATQTQDKVEGGKAAKAATPAPARESTASPAASDSVGQAGAVDVGEAPPPETWGSDPFVRDWIMVNELANLTLKAITVGGERSYALINDQILEEGDEISGKRIVKIETDKVTLEQGGRTFTLLLGE